MIGILSHVPIFIGADGPKGRALAADIGDGIFGSGMPPIGDDLPSWRGILTFGTVLGAERDPERREGHERGWACGGGRVSRRRTRRRGADAVDGLPGGHLWREAIEEIDPDRRHLAVHEGHLARVTDRDRPAVTAGIDLLPKVSFTGTAAELRDRVAQLRDVGVTEIAYQPAGDDIPGELERFINAVG